MKSNLFIIIVAANLLTGCTRSISESPYKEPQDEQSFYSLDNRNILIKIAEEKFGKLTEADEILFAAVADGNCTDYSEGGDKEKIGDVNNWGERRTINADRIEWLCCDKQAKQLVTDRGIQVIGAKIKGTLDLSFAEVPFPLYFGGCVFTEEINILYSRMKFLNLVGSHTDSIGADGVKVEGGVYLRNGFKANGEVRFPTAKIDGDFDCGRGEFVNKNGTAILADRMNVQNSVHLDNGFKASGMVCFRGATVGGTFECDDGEFVNEDGTAIVADRIDVKGSVFLRNGFKAKGEVRFPNAMIGGDFDCSKSEFTNEDSIVILANGINVEGTVFLNHGFKANGEVRFLGASIGGNFDCEKGEFINKGSDAISADRMFVRGSVFLRDGFKADGRIRFPGALINGDFDCKDGIFINARKDDYAIAANRMEVNGNVLLSDGFKANGEVRFLGAVINGNFDCKDGSFINVNKNGYAIVADGIDVKGNVFLINNFNANGEVRFLEARIGGQFNCQNGKFINKNGSAITANGMDVKNKVLLIDGFKAEGEVCFPNATIGGNFVCENSEFINKGKAAISADGITTNGGLFLRNGFKAEGRVSIVGAIVHGHFFWSDVEHPERTILDMRNAKAGVLWDDEKSWPAKGNLILEGFVYEDIGDDAPKDAKSRIEWLNRQGDERFWPGPYEQLAKVLEKMGHYEDAKKIRIEKERKMTELGDFGWWTRFWRDVLRFTIGYGYRPWRALWFIGGFILFGFMVFRSGHKAGVIVHAGEKTYNKFNALVYSIEKFVPVVNLSMAKYWIPDASKRWGAIIRCYMWLHIIFGWILTTLLIVGLTGLVK
jgi:sRNA-binding regulator protein Hfq